MSGSHRYLDALAALHAMLSSYPTQAELAAIHFGLTPDRRITVTVHLRPAEPAILAAGLVDWERTLGLTETWAWRTPNGTELHLALTGSGDGGQTPVAVVAGPVLYDDRRLDVDLEPGMPEQLDTDTLYRWLGMEIAQSWPFKE